MYDAGRSEAAKDRPPERSRRNATPLTVGPVLVWLSLAAVAIIVAGIVGHVLELRDATYRAAQTQARTATQLLAENTARLFDAADFVLEATAEEVAGRPWDEVAADRRLWADMAADARRFQYIEALWLNDAEGMLRQSTIAFPTPPSDAADRDFYHHFADGGTGPYISEPIIGRVTNEPTFLLTHALKGPGNRFRGIASVTLDAAYFSSFLETFSLPYDASIMLVRGIDGRVLTAEPEPTLHGETVAPAVMERLEAGVVTAVLDEGDSVGWVRRVEGWPVYAVVRFQRDAIDKAWFEQVTTYVVIGGLALIALIGLATYARAVERAARD